LHKEQLINDKSRDILKDLTFDEDHKFLCLFKNYHEKGEEEVKNDQGLKDVIINYVDELRAPQINIIM